MGFALCLGLGYIVTAGSERTEDAVVVLQLSIALSLLINSVVIISVSYK
jgi:hypothetical protein